MRNEMRPHTAIAEIHQVEPRYARGKGEVSDTDEVSIADAVVMPLQSIERAPKQTGSDPAVESLCFSESESSPHGPRSKAGQRKIHEKPTRKYQDVELTCR
jgi:hypothetical protein